MLWPGQCPPPTHERTHTKREGERKRFKTSKKKSKLKIETKQFLDNYFHKISSSK